MSDEDKKAHGGEEWTIPPSKKVVLNEQGVAVISVKDFYRRPQLDGRPAISSVRFRRFAKAGP